MAYANSVDPDQISLIWVYSVCHSTKYFKKQLQKKQYLSKKKKKMEWSVRNFRTFTVTPLSSHKVLYVFVQK